MAKPLSRKAALAMGALAVYLNPKMAQDATIDVAGLLNGITAKNWKSQKARLAEKLKAATAGKLAQDADLEDVIEMLDQLDDVTDEVADAIDESKPMSTDDDSNMMGRLREFLKGRLSEEDMAALEAMMTTPASAADEPPPFVKKKDGDDDKVSKTAMDAAIKAAVSKTKTETEQATIQRLNAIQTAVRDVRPFIGEIEIAQDSAHAVYKLALDHLKVDLTDVPAEAYGALLKALPKPGDQKTPRPGPLAMDAAAAKSYAERFPNAGRLKH